MNILVSCIPFDNGKSGISVYIREVVRTLAARGHQLTLILEPDAVPFFPGFPHIVTPPCTRKPLLGMLYHLWCLPRKLDWKRYDCCLVTAANRRMFSRLPIHTVAVVHDLSQYHVHAKYDLFRMFYIKHLLPHYVRRAHRVVAISHSTAHDLEKHWHISPERLSVVLNGVTLPSGAPQFQPGQQPAKPYILYVSRLEHPGKNHVNLIKAYDLLPDELTSAYDLILPGAPWNGSDQVYQAARQSRHPDHIQFPGFVSTEQCHALIAHAACYVFPSLYEGFGLSLVEAMHFSIPCACSNSSSLREIGHDAALLFNPQDPEDIKRQLTNILTSPRRQQELKNQGRKRAKLYDWNITAEKLEQELKPERPTIFKVPCDNVTADTALKQLRDMVTEARRTQQPAMAAFINAHCLNVACRNQDYRECLRDAKAIWPDGIGVKIAGKVLGFPIPENLNGTDFIPQIARQGYSFFFLGAKPGISKKAMEYARKDFPQSTFLGSASGYFKKPNQEQKTLDKINRLNPDILLVAMGVPKQELWARQHLKDLRCGIVIPVGGLFDFMSQNIPRAPRWMRKAGLEWLFRLACEPRRMFMRYVVGNPLFLGRLLLHKLFRRD